ncbi:hypothetical protein [Algoriphagus confluentis]|uniref:Uncharacterized protein n=1 Tax=Algoriphagus confluentis TaxID=1697556 RepID=A0ABQ6PM88_9BACT|nr:hypothetical protein Aconfl_17300 [Algoriphagus confluentis]
MNKHIKNLSLGFILSVILGFLVYSSNNKFELGGYMIGAIFGGGVSLFLISLGVSSIIGLIFRFFKKSFWGVFYKCFWLIFLLTSFFVLVGTFI